MTIKEAIDTLKAVLTKTDDKEVETAVNNSINQLNNFGKDTLANKDGEDFELPKNVRELITGMDSNYNYGRPYKINNSWAQKLNRAVSSLNGNKSSKKP